MIPPESITRIRESTDLLALVQRSVPLKRAGASWKGLCPFHAEKSASFHVSPAKQLFHCFGCGESGDAFDFLIKTQRLSFMEAARQLAEAAGIVLEEQERDPRAEAEAKEREELYRLLELASEWFRRNFQETSEAKEAREYAERRGLSAAALERFQIGYAPQDGQALERAALKRGYAREQLLKAGLLVSNERGAYSRFRQRLIFPIQDARARVVGFGGRILGSGEPKYLNSPETSLFSKGRLLYALPQAKEALLKKKRVLLTEGYMDAIACHQAGVEETLAVLGTAFSEEHAKQIKRYCEKVLLVFDADSAGLKAALKAAELLLKTGLEPRVVRLGSQKDPDEFIKAQGLQAFEAELDKASEALEFFADGFLRLAKAKAGEVPLSLRERAALMTQLFPLLERYATAMEAEVQLRKAAERFDLPYEAARSDFERYKAAPKGSSSSASDLVLEAPPPPQAATTERRESQERIENELLALLVSHPELQEEAIRDLPEPLFSSEELRAAAGILWKQPGRPLMALEDDGSEEFRRGEALLSRLAMESGERFTSPAAQLRELLLRRQLGELEERAAKVQQSLDARPSAESEAELLREKMELKVAIQHLKQG